VGSFPPRFFLDFRLFLDFLNERVPAIIYTIYILFKSVNFAKSSIQHYPPGTQENYSNFPSRNLMMEKGKELEFPEGRGGLESAKRILMTGGSPYFNLYAAALSTGNPGKL
jgi:hypothetical protein